MTRVSRRQFVSRAAEAGVGLATGTATLAAARSPHAGPSQKVTLGVIGLGRGGGLARGFSALPDCQVAYLADVDTRRIASVQRAVEKAQGRAAKPVQDFRRILDDRSVDAVVVATPDHWHALATIWSCQAGKDVYVEKPTSHNVWEGRKMVEAARKYQRVVQVGTQNRSAAYINKAKQYLDSGRLGKVHTCRVYHERSGIGAVHAVPDSTAPAELDYDMWTGPAPLEPFNENRFRYWNWLWDFGGGLICVNGVHQLDIARWLLGKDYPKSVYAVGGRFENQAVIETPDVQVVTYEFDHLVMSCHLSLHTPYICDYNPRHWDEDLFPYWPQSAIRVEIYGSEGLLYVGRHGAGWQVFGKPREHQPVVVAQGYGRDPEPAHLRHFLECIKSRKRPNADIEEGHRSTLLCLYANISCRLGGQKLSIDPKNETSVGVDAAAALCKRTYRAPWVVPEQV